MKAIFAAPNIYSNTTALVFALLLSSNTAAAPGIHWLAQETAELRVNIPQGHNRATAKKAYAEGERLRRQGTAESLRKAIEKYEEELRQCRGLADRKGEASTLVFLGVVYNLLGEKQKALESYNQSLSLWRSLDDPKEVGSTLDNIGKLYETLGDRQKALEFFNQALAIRQNADDRYGKASTLISIGRIYRVLGEEQKALECFNQALAIRRAVNDSKGEASVFHHIGMVYYSLGERREALEYFIQALEIRRAMRQPREEASTLNSMGRTYHSLGEKQKAVVCFNQSLAIRRFVGDRSGEAETLSEIARLARDRGDLSEALRQIKDSLNIVESLRTKVASPELRASYFASVQSYYEFYIDLLMRLDRLYPSRGYDVAALQASERARARSLLEILIEPRANIRQGVDPSLLEHERSLLQQLNAKIEYQIRLLSDKLSPEKASPTMKEIQILATEYEQAQAQIRARSPGYESLGRLVPLDLKQIQEQLLDPDTLLLEYALGEEGSFLWLVTSTSMTTYPLPKREQIESVAESVIRFLTEGGTPQEFESKAADLSQILLGPIASRLGKKRLAIIADGMLQYLPFAAMPVPSPTGQRREYVPLVVEHEIVGLPSASALAMLRNQFAARKPAPKTLAIFADPVFTKDDKRVKAGSTVKRTTKTDFGDISQSESEWIGEQDNCRQRNNPRCQNPDSQLHMPLKEQNSENVTRSSHQFDFRHDRANWSRLPFSRREAEQILALIATSDVKAAFDFDASQTTAMSAELGQYRILHFATHGVLNNELPELSGLLLSLVNEKGESQDGFLSLSEISRLNLSAELVVLSACRTGLGKDIRGEGLLGLTREFMYAGAPRVVASLWAVQDRATLELMVRFYKAMMKQKLHPAAALREAQVSMWREGRWGADQWAGFVFQGDWRGKWR